MIRDSISHQREVFSSPCFQAMYSHDSKPTRTCIILLRTREGMELEVLNYNLRSEWVYPDLWPKSVSTFRGRAKSAIQNLRHGNGLSTHLIIREVLLLLHLNQPERSMYCTGVKAMLHKNLYSIDENVRMTKNTGNRFHECFVLLTIPTRRLELNNLTCSGFFPM